ncbi:MAG: co-chaperone GrpE [Frankiales bacterium]|nr:co-chaperone GrpE [Frankiales bacterium]
MSDVRDSEEGWDIDPDRVVIRDKRKLDPESGEVREPAATPASEAAEPEPEVDAAPDRVAELTADLQRVSAEYANYRKRVERDRVAVVEMATAGLLSGLLPVLDDIDRAREHGDLSGPFAAVASSLEQLTARLGLEQFGEAGEPFDPSVHEALMQAEPDASATVATCAAVLQKGYRLTGGRVLRPARVSVAEPAS